MNSANPSIDIQLVKDDRINLSEKKTVSVIRGGAEVYSQSFAATSQTPSLVNFSVNPASLNTLVNRSVRLRGRVQFRLSVVNGPADGAYMVSLGDTLAPGAGGFQRLVENASLTINNISTNLEYSRVYQEILRLFSPEELAEYFEGPIMPDTYFKHVATSVNPNNNPIGSYETSSGFSKFNPRGSYPPTSTAILNAAGAYVENVALVANADVAGNTKTVFLTYDFSENLCQSPFCYGNKSIDTAECLYGINNIGLQLNLSSTLANRFFSYAGVPALTVSIEKVENCYLDFSFLTLPAVFSLPPVSMVNHFNLTTYPTNTTVNANATYWNSSETKQTSTITLNTIPEKFLIYVKPASPPSNQFSDYRLPITKLNIAFGNKTGLLSSMTEYQLYEMSRRNGLNMSFSDWRGFSALKQVGANIQTTRLATVGGLIVLSAEDLSLGLDQAPGEVSQITFQASVDIRNQTGADAPVQIIVVPIQLGILSTASGSSQITYSNLNRSMVIDALEGKSEMLSASEAGRMLGSGFWDSFKSIMKTSAPYAKQILRSIPDQRAQLGANLLETAGYGYSAGAKKSRFM